MHASEEAKDGWNSEPKLVALVKEERAYRGGLHRAFCYIIPPVEGIKIELDYGDGKKDGEGETGEEKSGGEEKKKGEQEIGLGSMFGYVGAFEYRYRNHSARVKLVKSAADPQTVSSSRPVSPPVPYLYRIDLRKLKRLKGMNAAVCDELFTHSELRFIAHIRGLLTPEFSQIQDNTSLASIAEHGKVCA